MKRLLVVVAVFLVASLFGWTSSLAAPGARPALQQVTISLHSSPTRGEVLSASDFAVEPGAPVTVTFLNYTREYHTFTVPGLHVSALIKPGSPAAPRATRVTFTAYELRVYRWYCAFCPDVHHLGPMRGKVYAIIRV